MRAIHETTDGVCISHLLLCDKLSPNAAPREIPGGLTSQQSRRAGPPSPSSEEAKPPLSGVWLGREGSEQGTLCFWGGGEDAEGRMEVITSRNLVWKCCPLTLWPTGTILARAPGEDGGAGGRGAGRWSSSRLATPSALSRGGRRERSATRLQTHSGSSAIAAPRPGRCTVTLKGLLTRHLHLWERNRGEGIV